jgi:ribose transport system permease protein
MTFLIILGEIDLSVGSLLAMSCTVCVILQKYGVGWGVLGGLAIGLIVGLINGFFVVKLRVASIAATMGMMILLNGIVFVVCKALAPAGGNYSIAGTNENFKYITETRILGIPSLILILVALILIFSFLLARTSFGRSIYATGGNLLASRYANIKVDRIRISAFALTGVLAGLAGVLLVSKYNIASWELGSNTPLFVITAVLLGGVSIAGGEGSLLRAFEGLLVIGVIDDTMIALKVYPSLKFLVLGVLLIVMLSIDGVRIRRAKFQ